MKRKGSEARAELPCIHCLGKMTKDGSARKDKNFYRHADPLQCIGVLSLNLMQAQSASGKTPAESALIRAALAYCKARAEYQAAHMETPEEHAAYQRMIKAQADMDRAAARVVREREGRERGA